MSNHQLTVQLFYAQQWHDAAMLDFKEPDAGSIGCCTLEYCFDYAFELCDSVPSAESGCSLRYPVQLMEHHTRQPWFSFIDDIIPSGAARRYWTRNLGIEHLKRNEQDFLLLSKGAIAPVGNMRIKEALPYNADGSKIDSIRFSLDSVLERNSDFLQHATELGAVGGGATGAGGEAPKYLIRCSKDQKVWIDAYQDEPTNTDQHYLVKFPRNRRTDIDKDILRAEYVFYNVLESLGIETISTKAMKLYDDGSQVSLWLPRFDVGLTSEGQFSHYGLESVYSVLEMPAGSHMKHLNVLSELIGLMEPQGVECDHQSFVNEWIKRDFLNVVFGNSDNHGRNSSLLKQPGLPVKLAPVYDFAPMKADPEGVIRTTTWGTDSGLESGGNFDWIAIALATENTLAAKGYNVSAEAIITELSTLAHKLVDLKDRLHSEKLPENILNMPSIGFGFLDQRLKKWSLI